MNTCHRSPKPVRHSRSAHDKARAFTLIEILVVVAVIALLFAILLPTLQKARKQGRMAKCLSNLHQISIALYSYQAEHKGKPPRWPYHNENWTDPICLWAGGPTPSGYATRLGQLYPKYISKDENVLFCPDANANALLSRDSRGGTTGGTTYGWEGWGKSWTYGSYEYRPHWYSGDDGPVWVQEVDYGKGAASKAIAADSFSGWWHGWGPYPSHSPIRNGPKELIYNVAYTDGSAKRVKDPLHKADVAPFGPEFHTRAPVGAQQNPYTINENRPGGLGQVTAAPEYTHLNPVGSAPLPPKSRNDPQRDVRLATERHIERGWTFFDTQ